MSKKAQLDFPIISLVAIIFMLLLLSPVMLKIIIGVKDGVSPQLGNLTTMGGAIAQENFNHVLDTGINLWDEVVIFSFFLSVIVMFISALFIDTSPFWIILYIIVAFLLVIFAPTIISSLDSIYDSTTFSTETALTPFLVFLKDNFAAVLVGLIITTGILIYGKIALFSGGVRR